MWKQKLGDKATYRNLILAFENAGYQEYASTVRKLAADRSCEQKNCFSGGSFSSHSYSPLLLLQKPVFPNITDTVLLHKQGNLNFYYIVNSVVGAWGSLALYKLWSSSVVCICVECGVVRHFIKAFFT